MIRIGIAGWSIASPSAHHFAGTGTHLERYARRFNCVEINSSFYRHHACATYARWAAATPPGFQFAVKLTRTITHEERLSRSRSLLEEFLAETSGLGGKRGPILVQLPPSLTFDARAAGRFFNAFRTLFEGPIVCEPRHPTWFAAAAGQLLEDHRVARVAADPARAAGADAPGGWRGINYFRLHGSPRTYWSRYDSAHLERLECELRNVAARSDAWCVFDNTAAGAAVENARELQTLLGGHGL